jgi:seryl-tRNA synthetase
MPLGLWKSKWEIHREDMERFREEVDRRDVEYRGDRARSDERWVELQEETRDLRADYNGEIAETRLFNRELLARLEKTYGNVGATMELVGDEVHELKAAVDAQTEAILRLVDRFEGTDGRPPV